MLLKRLLLIAAIGILVMASCARRAVHFSDEITNEIVSEMGFSEDVRVTRIINGEKVYSGIHNFDDDHTDTELEKVFEDMDNLDFDLEKISFDFTDGFSVQLTGDEDGSPINISAEFSEDDMGEIVIGSGSDTGR